MGAATMRPGKKTAPLQPLRWRLLAEEMLSHGFMFWVAWRGGLGYLGLIALLVVEMLAIQLVSVVLYPQRGWRRHARDLVLSAVIFAVLVFFLVVIHASSTHGDSANALDVARGIVGDLDARAIAWAVALSVVHLLLMLRWSLSQPDPRLAWTQNVLSQGAATMLALLAMTFVSGFLAAMLESIGRGSAGVIATACAGALVLLRFAVVLIARRLPQSDMADNRPASVREVSAPASLRPAAHDLG